MLAANRRPCQSINAMELPPALLQFLGSLAAILVLAAIAWGLKLGPERKLASEEDTRAAAAEAVDGFVATDIARARDGRAALLADHGGRILLLRSHGTHMAGRVLTRAASAQITDGALLVDTGERRYGAVRLELDDPQAWVKRIEAIG